VPAAACIVYARINPEQGRHFAQATGRRAKADALDARMLAEFGRRLAPHAAAPDDPARARPTALSRRRDQIVAIRKQEHTRRSEEAAPFIAAARKLLTILDAIIRQQTSIAQQT
jgi:transposase